jgi:hypothetical protein
MRYSFMSTFAELRVEAERDIRAHIRRAGGDTTNYFVAQGAVLVASVQLWAQICKKTDTDARRAIESADEGSLQNVAEELVENGDADAWAAGQLLQHIADRPAWLLLETSQYATRAWALVSNERQSQRWRLAGRRSAALIHR